MEVAWCHLPSLPHCRQSGWGSAGSDRWSARCWSEGLGVPGLEVLQPAHVGWFFCWFVFTQREHSLSETFPLRGIDGSLTSTILN